MLKIYSSQIKKCRKKDVKIFHITHLYKKRLPKKEIAELLNTKTVPLCSTINGE